MKKIKIIKILIAITFILSFAFNVNAETIKIGKNSVVKSTGSFELCGLYPDPLKIILKSGKLIFQDDDTNDTDYNSIKAWDNKNGCQETTVDERLAYINRKASYYDSVYHGFDTESINYVEEYYGVGVDDYYILNEDSYNNETSYYVKEGSNYSINKNVTVENFSSLKNLYVKNNFVHISSTKLDSNVKYYYYDADANCMVKYDNLNKIEDYYNVYEKTNFLENGKELDTGIKISLDKLDLSETGDTINNINGKFYLSLFFTENSMNTYEISIFKDEVKLEESEKFKNKLILNSVKGFDTSEYILILDNDKNLSILDANLNLVDSFKINDIDAYSIYNDGTGLMIYYLDSNNKYSYKYYDIYRVLNGDNQVFKDKDITISYSGDLGDFKELRINNKVVSDKNYTVKSGSTIITLKSDYLKTLDNGEYTVTAVYNNGAEVSATLTHNGEKSLPINEQKKEEKSIKKDNEKISSKEDKQEETKKENPDTGSFITIGTVVILCAAGYAINYYTKKHKKFN